MPVFGENSAPVNEAANLAITTANVSQVVFADRERSYLFVQNNSDTDLFLFIGTASANNAIPYGIRLVANGGGFVAEDGFIPSGIVSIKCVSAGKIFYALEG